MSLDPTTGRIWDEARVARRRPAWPGGSRPPGGPPRPGRRPDPGDFLARRPRPGPAPCSPCSAPTSASAGRPARRSGAERYRDRYPDLGAETLVALVYEEFCLREEAGEAPDPAEYDGRFPELAGRLREVLDIHELVGSGPARPPSHAPSRPAVAVPRGRARRSPGSAWSRSWAGGRSPGSSSPRSGSSPTARSP